MHLKKLLIANRGEIAIRIARAANETGIAAVAVYSSDDAQSLHVRAADTAHGLTGTGVAAYLDGAGIIAAALQHDCDAIHPGYGFLAENADFARQVATAGLTFIGPDPTTLELFGDKAKARAIATKFGVPVLPGTNGPTSLEAAQVFAGSLGPNGAVMIKALAGGGGRGMRPVQPGEDFAAAFERCRSEAQAAFGNGELYVEQLFPRARHIEVQILGDGTGSVTHLWERECSTQRQRQKIIEIAPAPFLRPALRDRLLHAAVTLAAGVRYRNAGTFEFLVDASVDADNAAFAFIEANARLQVEHTVTEEVTGIDIVQAQLAIAGGATLAELDLLQAAVPPPRGMAMQVRVNMETMAPDGTARPAGGTLTSFEPPTGPGVRVDAFGYAGYRTSPRFDSLLAKVIVHVRIGGLPAASAKALRALTEFRIQGVPTNISFLQKVLRHPGFLAGDLHTTFIEQHMSELLVTDAPATSAATAGARVNASDPLAVLTHGREGGVAVASLVPPPAPADIVGPVGTIALAAPMQGTIVALAIAEGAIVRAGQPVLVMEAMKMEHEILATVSGILRLLTIEPGDTVYEGHALAFIEQSDIGDAAIADTQVIDLDHIRPDLAEVLARQAQTRDAARPDAVARRRKTGQRTVRENIEDLCDPGSFVEYGSLAIAARRLRASIE